MASAPVVMALDLSKSTLGSFASSKPPSPTLSSDLDTSLDRPSSAFSDGVDRDGDRVYHSSFTGAKGAIVKPIPGPIPSPQQIRSSSADITDEKLSPGSMNSRPFKMYPFDPMSNMYSQVAASAASLSAAGLYNPFAGAAAPGINSAGFPGMMDHALGFSSPITQYIQQKRRRTDGRTSYSKVDISEALKSPCSNTSDISSTSRDHSQIPVSSPGAGPSSPGSSITDDTDSQEHPSKKHKGESIMDGSVEERREYSYWDRRRKNNEAAKRSRDSRRAKEEEIALRAAYLEQENLKLRAQVTILKNETAKLHYMLYNRL